MVIIGGTGSIMGTLMGTAFVVLLPESMEWTRAGLRWQRAIDKALSLNNNITFLREIAIGLIIIAFLMFGPDGLAHRWRQIRTYWKLPTRFRIEVGTGLATMNLKHKTGGMLMTMKSLLGTVSLALLLGAAATSAQAQIAIGHLEDLSGGTSDVGTPYGQGVADTLAWVNKNGGVGGKQLNVDSNDYGYQCCRAIALYKKWSGGDKVAAIMGWGTADTEALTVFLAQDKIPDISGSYAAALSDPEGTSGKAKAAPYNFFYGPTYSDALRAELTWAAEDWKAKGKPGKPKFVHMGANHPYPNAPKAAGEALATELGFEAVLPPLVFALVAGRLQRAMPEPQKRRRQLALI